MELHIDEEFQGLLPQLTEKERNDLEEQIKRDGVLNPIIVWNGTIVDGHNRYMICKLNGITDFPIKEMPFSSRDDVIEWILKHQLGRRNLSDFQRTRIALRYEEMIAKKAKERAEESRSKFHGNQHVEVSCSTEHHTKTSDTHKTRDEIAKIAGTSGATVMRTKYILENGTEEQIARAERGGKEMDGRSNSVSAITKEIKEEKKPFEKTKICTDCGEEKPLSAFAPKQSCCNSCRHKREKIRGGEEFIRDLHDKDKVIEYTASDLEEEVRENVEPIVKIIEVTINQHKELMNDSGCRALIRSILSDVVNKVERIVEVYCNGEICI